MSQYIVLNRISIQNANCIAGFTWGFPAITHFLGFTHALRRKLEKDFSISLSGCAVICHDYQVHGYRPKPYSDFQFIQSKNPPYLPKHGKKSNPPIIEEGKMNLTVSLVLELDRELVGTTGFKNNFKEKLVEQCLKSKLAGGVVLFTGEVSILSASTKDDRRKMNYRVKRLLMPGFVLMDRSDALAKHYDTLITENGGAELLDAWLDFSTLKFKATPLPESKDEKVDQNTKAKWELLGKPATGWMVPIMTGYKAISPVYAPGEVENARDSEVPVCFVEAVHSVGEWKGIHRLKDISEAIWRYDFENEWYLCKQSSVSKRVPDKISNTDIESFLENL